MTSKCRKRESKMDVVEVWSLARRSASRCWSGGVATADEVVGRCALYTAVLVAWPVSTEARR